MKTTTYIVAAFLALFSTVYSSSWCMCSPEVAPGAPAGCGSCCETAQQPDNCSDAPAGHCTRFENRTEAVSGAQAAYSVTLQSSPVPVPYHAAAAAPAAERCSAVTATGIGGISPPFSAVLRI